MVTWEALVKREHVTMNSERFLTNASLLFLAAQYKHLLVFRHTD